MYWWVTVKMMIFDMNLFLTGGDFNESTLIYSNASADGALD